MVQGAGEGGGGWEEPQLFWEAGLAQVLGLMDKIRGHTLDLGWGGSAASFSLPNTIVLC